MPMFTQSAVCIVCQAPMKAMFVRAPFTYVRCIRCSHVTTMPYPTREQLVAHYDESFKSKGYQVVCRHSEVYQSSMAKLAHRLAKQAGNHDQEKPLNGKLILDIGCFTGEFLVKVKQLGGEVYGLELQDEAVRIANVKLGSGIVLHADVIHDELPWPSASFDAVTLLGLIEHVTDPDQLLKKIYRLLKPGGTLMLQTPDSSTLIAKVLGKWWLPYTPVEHIHIFSSKSIACLLEQSGFWCVDTHVHVKWLALSYIYGMLSTFGPRLRSLFRL